MGARQTKIEGTYLPETPTVMAGKVCMPVDMDEANDCEKNVDVQDPRSPNICRTPISIFSATYQCSESEQIAKVNQTESAVGQLRKRFFKGFSYNLNDPRSPGYQFNRTPISFDDSQDKILNLDDTFADLFAETQVHTFVHTDTKIDQDSKLSAPESGENTESDAAYEELNAVIKDVNESLDCLKENSNSEVVASSLPSELTLSPKILQDEIDPRSPTIGVDRTPIIFNDDEDETHESILLESILATLSLDMSNSSFCSLGTPNREATSPHQKIDSSKTDRQGQLFRKITHKRMRRTHVNEKISLTRRTPIDEEMSPQRVFEDCENVVANSNVERKLKMQQKDSHGNTNKRTPLSCIKNKRNLHTKSEEYSMKSHRARLENANDDNFTIG
ncbi:PREDICTED: uncharacterized protein LOC108381420 isoform X1 [Rhagoletis zephyria]|uniref:uncharacterized protein LOC108381420 isoform X1 n=2 Tax=Rhagoletis zephyria TaxID=28612 RepID=UPI0008117B1D|nr:PREDICTED: uncharacterized protein LOC108381420 isoform X1 [Rhagoletis zephyria]